MIRSVVKSNLNVNYRIACKHAGLHSALDTCVDCGDIFLGNNTAGDGVDKFIALAGVGLDLDLNVTVLAVTAALTGEFGVGIGFLTDGFFISNLGLTYVCLDVELTHHSVDDDFKVKLTHAGDDGLSGLFVGVALKGRIFFGKLLKSDTHFLLTCFGLGLDCYADNRIGEFHGFEDNRDDSDCREYRRWWCS